MYSSAHSRNFLVACFEPNPCVSSRRVCTACILQSKSVPMRIAYFWNCAGTVAFRPYAIFTSWPSASNFCARSVHILPVLPMPQTEFISNTFICFNLRTIFIPSPNRHKPLPAHAPTCRSSCPWQSDFHNTFWHSHQMARCRAVPKSASRFPPSPANLLR